MEISGKSFHLNLRFENMGSQIWNKIEGIVYRFLSYVHQIPLRVFRLLKHLFNGIYGGFSKNHESRVRPFIDRLGLWWIYFLFYLMDVLGLPEIFETVIDIVKFNSRPLNKWEIDLAKSVFGNTINYQRVRIDEYSFVGPKQRRFCYVSFYSINSWGPMQNSVLIHEITHIWQFEKMGSVYIPKALLAQQTAEGYNYGGVKALRTGREMGKSFLSFNFEQQGDIISDYFRIREGYKPRWGDATRMDLPIYEAFVDEVRKI
jgi:hypothetical protein